jgi:pyruvate formate lyase activating enzyme
MAEPHEAMLYEKLDGEKVRCGLCGHQCVILGGKYGLCRVRQNVAGELRSLTYGTLVALNVDPIEKKPFFHYLPGTKSLSIAAPGCNFQCEFCQNWQISQSPRADSEVRGQAVSPEQVVSGAIAHDCASISYTYTEPTVFFEMAYDTARLARARGLGNTFVSNGYMTREAVDMIAPYLDAINVDLKAFSDETYKRVMKARLEPVLTALRALVAAGVWVEVTTLVVPGMNDSPQELRDIAGFIAKDLGTSVPWHVSRFHGDYKMADVRATPIETMELACRIGREAGLRFVYSGNLAGHADESTHCPNCRELLIDRQGYFVRGVYLRDGRCPKCNEAIEGIWARPPHP